MSPTRPRPSTSPCSWRGDLRFIGGEPGGPTVEIDADNATAPGPMLQLPAAPRASCSAADAVLMFRKMHVQLESLEVKLDGLRRVDDPRRYTAIHFDWAIRGTGLDESQGPPRDRPLHREVLLGASHSLAPDIAVSYDLQLGSPRSGGRPGGAAPGESTRARGGARDGGDRRGTGGLTAGVTASLRPSHRTRAARTPAAASRTGARWGGRNWWRTFSSNPRSHARRAVWRRGSPRFGSGVADGFIALLLGVEGEPGGRGDGSSRPGSAGSPPRGGLSVAKASAVVAVQGVMRNRSGRMSRGGVCHLPSVPTRWAWTCTTGRQ